jgi:hypothetical protein
MLAAVAAPIHSPRAQNANPGPSIPISSPREASNSVLAHGQIVREIDDPSSGARWLLVREMEHPGGPGRLVEVFPAQSSGRRIEAAASVAQPVPRPAIRAGDRLIVEENTAVVEARLEAVALGPAAVGSELGVRLKIGGKVLRAVALGPGRAAFKPETEARP